MREIKDSPRSLVKIGYDGRVHKTFRGKDADQRFATEVRILNLLEERGCGYVPQVIDTDPETLYLCTTNCGQIVNKMNPDKIDLLFSTLEKEFGVIHGDPFLRNITYRMTDGRFCLIDFELAEEVPDWQQPSAAHQTEEAS